MNRLIAASMLSLALLAGPALAKPAPDAVAQVIEIKGKQKLDYQRGTDWKTAYVYMDNKVKDKLRTDAETVAALEFLMGGRVGINKNTVLTIVSEGEASAQGARGVKKIVLEAGGIWAKVGKRTETLEIQTHGGVMGIKGTEFVIETQENGTTSVAVMEGQVEVSDLEGKKLADVNPGEKFIMPYKDVPVKKTYDSPESLREEIKSSQEWQDFQEAMAWVSMITAYTPVALPSAVGAVGYLASVDFERDPVGSAEALANAASSAGAHVPSEVGWGFSIARHAQSNEPKKPDFPTGLSPDDSRDGGKVAGPPSFRWDPMEGAAGYVVMVGTDENFEQALVWAAKVKETAATYPSEAQPLQAGQRYYWRLIPTDGEWKALEGKRGSQTYFEVQSW
ncbi:MAG: FecR domain-containing protein [Armatimonadetes bacterium]|nr:FecR domain-containing protein [Armatimonadota bacterium]